MELTTRSRVQATLMALSVTAALAAGIPQARAQSATNLILNGNFDETTNGEGAFFTGTGTRANSRTGSDRSVGSSRISISGSTMTPGWSA